MKNFNNIIKQIKKLKDSKSNEIIKNIEIVPISDNYKEMRRTITTRETTIDSLQANHLIESTFNAINRELANIDDIENRKLGIKDEYFLSHEFIDNEYHVHYTIKYRII